MPGDLGRGSTLVAVSKISQGIRTSLGMTNVRGSRTDASLWSSTLRWYFRRCALRRQTYVESCLILRFHGPFFLAHEIREMKGHHTQLEPLPGGWRLSRGHWFTAFLRYHGSCTKEPEQRKITAQSHFGQCCFESKVS